MLMATQSPAIVVTVTAVMFAIGIVAVFLRVIARKQKRQPLEADDIFCFIALLLSAGLVTTIFTGVAQKALAYPTPISAPIQARTALETSNDKTKTVSRLGYIYRLISLVALGTTKLSVVCFYRRIWVVDKTNFRNLHNVLYIGIIALIGIWTGGFTFSFMFACKVNFTAFWTSAISLITKCADTLEMTFALAVSDFILDCIIILLPLPMIWRLHLPLASEIGVLCVFLLGILATVASLIRMVWVIWARNVGFDVSLDQNLLITTSLFWTMLEVSLGIIAACLPTLRGLVQKKSVDSLVNSIREKMSIRSAASIRSEDSLALTQINREQVSYQGNDFITMAGQTHV